MAIIAQILFIILTATALYLFSKNLLLIRRNILKIKRFFGKEMTKWPKTDANLILIFEVFLMSAFFLMNAADQVLQSKDVSHYLHAGSFPISSLLLVIIDGFSVETLILIERVSWWFHILVIL